MSGLSFRQGTLYTDENGKGFLLINHNPMALQSLQVPADNGVYNSSAASPLAIDDLIDIRKEGTLQDRGDVPPEVLAAVLSEILADSQIPESDRPLLENILQEVHHG